MTSYTRPSIYVGTYHKYNCGSIYGAWIDVLDYDDKAEFYAHCSTLHADEADPELMFQDWEGFPSGTVSESHIDWTFIDGLRSAIQDGQYEAYSEYVRYYKNTDYEAFESVYLGEAENEESYIREQLDQDCAFADFPAFVVDYFDYEAYARDQFLNGLTFSNGYVFG